MSAAPEGRRRRDPRPCSQYGLARLLDLSALLALYLGITLLTSVPDYPNEARGEQVICGGARARHDPGCNAVGYWDRLILTPQHMYRNPTFRNLHECRTPPESAQPTWCTMPFEAEGVVSSILSCVSVVFGTFTGQVLLAMQVITISWPWVSACGSLEPPRRDGENAQKTGKNGGKTGEI